jgi:hypothetical protein
MLQGPEVRDRLRRARGVTYARAATMVTLKNIARQRGSTAPHVFEVVA